MEICAFSSTKNAEAFYCEDVVQNLNVNSLMNPWFFRLCMLNHGIPSPFRVFLELFSLS